MCFAVLHFSQIYELHFPGFGPLASVSCSEKTYGYPLQAFRPFLLHVYHQLVIHLCYSTVYLKKIINTFCKFYILR